jgi:FAD-dependent oxidoreductase domain-containing protein 1
MATTDENDKTFDVIIIGGGVIGCSVAYHLVTQDPGLRVLVVERDPTYRRASSALSVGNVRVQFSLPQNIEISQHTLDVLRRFPEEMEVDGNRPEVAFKQEANLFLLHDEAAEKARSALELQQRLGCQVDWLLPTEIKERFPRFRVSDFAAGTLGGEDGHLDGYAFLMAYRRRAMSLGALFLHDEVVRPTLSLGTVAGVELASGKRLSAPIIVNCAGAWAADVLRGAGVSLPVQPVQRQVFCVEPENKPQRPLPLTNLPSGLYFRSEGDDRLIVGRSLPDDPVGYRFDWQERRFNDLLWPELAEIVPSFERLRFERGWTGLYAVNTFDGNAILGRWPEVEGLYLANGFSGHGLQQAPAVGRYLSELIVGRQPILDLAALGPERILLGEPLTERAAV